MAFRQRLEGLLSGADPLFNFGVGLLGAGGENFGQDLGAAVQFSSQRQVEAMRNQALRAQIEQQRRQQEAQQQLAGLLGGGAQAVRAGADQGNLMGLLAQANPEAFTQAAITGLLASPQERADPADLRLMDAIGLPRTPEGFAQLQSLKSDESNKSAIDALNLQIQGLQLANMQREQQVQEREARERRLTQENAIEDGIQQAIKIAKLTENLEGTVLAAGLPAAEWRRGGAGVAAAVGGALGLDVDKLNADVAEFDKLKKNLNDQLISLMSAGTLGQATDSKLQQYRDSLASMDTMSPAVMEIQAGIAETLLDQADVMEFELPNRDTIEASIERMRGYVPPGTDTVVDIPGAAVATGRAVVRAADIGRMSLQQLEKVDTTGWSREMLEAAAKRWDELNAE